jgi:hypothetical protein
LLLPTPVSFLHVIQRKLCDEFGGKCVVHVKKKKEKKAIPIYSRVNSEKFSEIKKVHMHSC